MSPPLASWIVVAVALIVTATFVVYTLRRITPEICLGARNLVGVPLISRVSAPALGVVTAVLNPATFSFVYVAAALYFVASDPRGPVALTIVLAVAVLLGSVAAPARLRSIGFDERHAEADLAATMARLLPRTDDLRCALLAGSGRLGRALTLSAAPIELDAVAGEEQRAAFALRDGGTLLVPADLPQTTERQARERVVGSVEALCVWRAIARGERP